MTADTSTASLKATGTTTSRTLAARFGQSINVKSYGAVGDGATNDTSAVQAALDAAFTTAGTPHGSANAHLNRPVFFPAGKYLINAPLTVTDLVGGVISGAGMRASKIVTATNSISLFTANGMIQTRFQGLDFVSNGAANGGTGITLDWDGTGVGLEFNMFYDCAFDAADIGVSIASSGNGGSFNYFDNVWIDACNTGVKAIGSAALFQTFSSGGVSNCNTYGLQATGGSFGTLQGTSFTANAVDLRIESAYPTSILGGYSTSPKFCEITTGKLNIYSFLHAAASADDFVDMTSPASVLVDGCAVNANSDGFRGTGHLICRNVARTTGGVSGLFTNFSGNLDDFQLPTGTFASLPGSPIEGMEGIITDGTGTPAWGDNITSGSSTQKFKVRYNGSNWTLVAK